jgi:hypothetical protein
MVGRDVVLVDGLLDQPHTEQAGVKGEIIPRLCRNCRQVVNSGQLHGVILLDDFPGKTGAAIWAFRMIM